MLTNEEDGTIVTWVLNMQMVVLSITLQQFKLKGVEITQTRPMPFEDGVQGGSW
jgi:hypothetical protein